MNDFERQMQQVLRRSERDIDDNTARDLAAARQTALGARSKQRVPRFFVPATGMALASVLALVLVLSPDIQDQPNPSAGQEEVLLSESIDLYEDMDFYYWLAGEESNLQG
ncbi:MAG: hypothetical protein EP334_10555 [Gammaproteobacteria bacterium]|nr:MAG: hypothetical protein EP334_10555 [Gammaproteobacteria bacterium]